MKLSPKKSVTKLLMTGLITLGALVGCSNDAADGPDLEETTDASSVEQTEYVPASEEGPAQNVPEPRLPALATENSEEGAQAALEYFWEAESYASLTGDSNPLVLVSSDDCAFCAESIEGWPRNYEAGYWSAMHGEIKVDVTEVQEGFDEEFGQDVAHLYFQLTEPPTDFFDKEGSHTDGSFDSEIEQDWLALLIYDATAQSWEIEWLGLEGSVEWEE